MSISTQSIVILPRQTMTKEEFLASTPASSIALDGIVSGGPFFDEKTLHVNFDHHSGVIREATMSTAKQVYFAIKGGLMSQFGRECSIYINDTDQDTALAVWLLLNYKLFERTQSIPHINRLLSLNDRLDITGGAFPINLDEEIVEKHNWIFKPYSILRTSGRLASADSTILRDNLEALLFRLDRFLMGQAEREPLDTRHEILWQNERFWIVNEIGGNEARYYLYGQGMDAFISIVATRADGRRVISAGRRSQFIPFPLPKIYQAFNAAEIAKIDPAQVSQFVGWGGSDIIGGSDRKLGSGLTNEELGRIALSVMEEKC